MEFQRLNKQAYLAKLIHSTIADLIIFGILCVIFFVVSAFHIPEAVKTLIFWGEIILMGLIILFNLLNSFVGISRFRYRISERAVEKRTGIFGYSHEIVPIRKMVQINVGQGLIGLWLHLVNVEITTPGSEIEISYLDEEVGRELAKLLTDKINRFSKEGK